MVIHYCPFSSLLQTDYNNGIYKEDYNNVINHLSASNSMSILQNLDKLDFKTKTFRPSHILQKSVAYTRDEIVFNSCKV